MKQKIYIAQIETAGRIRYSEFPRTGETIEIGTFSSLDLAKAAMEAALENGWWGSRDSTEDLNSYVIRVDELDPKLSKWRKTELFFLDRDVSTPMRSYWASTAS